MKAIISSFGSSGDFNPCLGLGRALCEKGVEVIFLANPFYEKKILNAGLRFSPAGEYFDVFKEIEGNSDYLHAMKGPRAVWEMVLRTIPVMHGAMKELIKEERPDFVASHILEYGGMLAAMEQSIPYATLCTTPMGWFNAKPPGYWNYPELPLWARSLQIRCIHFLMNIGFKYSLKRQCRKFGLPQEIECIEDVFGKAFANLGFWSETLRGRALDDPPSSKVCGFVRDEHIKDWKDVPGEIQRLFDGQKRPVVVGLGSTASLHGYDIYRAVAEACKKIDRPCLLIGKDLAKLSDPDKNIQTLDFAPFGWVFPRAGLIIHHGGLNTTAEALRAGVPSFVVPHAYDQFDNAIRVKHLGVACRMRVSRVTAESLAVVMKQIFGDTQMQQKAKETSQKIIAEPDGADVALGVLVDLFAGRRV